MKVVARRNVELGGSNNYSNGNNSYMNNMQMPMNNNYQMDNFNMESANLPMKNNMNYSNNNNYSNESGISAGTSRGNGYTYEYMLDNGQVVTNEQAYQLALDGQLEGVMASHNKGTKYIRGIGDGREGNDMNDLPSF